jgi:predicted phosphoadenosine phosphosulfate sulfurtransferase
MIKNGNKDVYKAAKERIKVAFDNFENILIAFSCGKEVEDNALHCEDCLDKWLETKQENEEK